MKSGNPSQHPAKLKINPQSNRIGTRVFLYTKIRTHAFYKKARKIINKFKNMPLSTAAAATIAAGTAAAGQIGSQFLGLIGQKKREKRAMANTRELMGIQFKNQKELDKYGQRIKNPYTGLSIVSDKQAEYNFWYQMLVGDVVDNVKGCKGIGPKKAEKILLESENYEQSVKDVYKLTYQDLWLSEFEKNHFFL